MLVILGLLSASSVQAQQADIVGESKSVIFPRLSSDPVIDGQLTEAVWSQAVVIEDLHQVFPREYVMPTEPTRVRVFYTENALYVGATLYESDTTEITDRVLRQGQSLAGDDVFAVIIDPCLD